MKTMILESKIKDLCDELKSSGKSGPADYYKSLIDRIKNPLNEVDKEEALQQIIGSGKLADMANFTAKEDELFDIVYNEAKALK